MARLCCVTILPMHHSWIPLFETDVDRIVNLVQGMANIEEMMAKAVTAKPEFYQSPGNVVEGFEERKKRLLQERKAKKATLTQWYGMQRVQMTPELEQELELLRYRALLEKGGARGNKIASKQSLPQFFEVGYFVGTGRKKRERQRSFADQWLAEDSALASKADVQLAKDVKAHRRDTKRQKSKLEAAKSKGARKIQGSERRRNKDEVGQKVKRH